MNPFKKRYYTQQEIDEAIREALAGYNSTDHPWLLARSDEELVQTIKAAMPLAPVETPAIRPLTAMEKAGQAVEVNLLSLFGGKYAVTEQVPDWYRPIHEAEQRASFEKFVGPGGQREQSTLKITVRELPIRESERPGIMPRFAKGASSTHLTKSGGRIEVDAGECTEYASNGALLRSWVGTPADRPNFESLAK